MNVVKLLGGIGNQLFQYAFGQLLPSPVRYVDSWYRKSEHINTPYPRPYCLDKFNISLRFADFRSNTLVREKGYNPEYLKMEKCNFYGYWQYLKYYENIIPGLKKQFKVKPNFYTRKYILLKKEILSCKSISVHVRRGDYLAKGHTVLPLSYYEEALSMVQGKVFVFSDDLEWCRKHFNGVTFVDIEDYLAFDLMRLCKHNIISNSTFSWWAAILNDNPRKTVIAPDKWIVNDCDKENYNNEIHYPKEWIKLSTCVNQFDVLIVAAQKDFNKLPYVVDSVKKNVIGYNKIYCITPVPCAKIPGVRFFLDGEVLDFDFDRINNRKGWYKQQFLKLFQNVTCDNYLSIDADVIINKPINPFNNGKPLFFIGNDQNHIPYFDLMEKLFNITREYDHSFISEIMFFKRNVILELLSTFHLSKYGFFEKVVNEINKCSHPSGFSEFELYGNFVTKYFNGMYDFKKIKTTVNGKHKDWEDGEIKSHIEKYEQCDIISMHTWT